QAPSPFPMSRGPAPTHRLRDSAESIRAREADARPPYPRDPRLAGRDHAAWAAVRRCERPHGHRPNRPDVSATGPESFGSASPLPPSGRPRVSSALERALGWDEVIGDIVQY